jgi:4,5:9,10-diseco-3-hydroxy-5,9,17-trioxoandrosta-1(10),2-diene-4-oate hydrolase
VKSHQIGQGPALLLLHGFPTSGRLWDPALEALAETHTCVVVDLPGFGDSAPLPGGAMEPEAFVRELEALREALGHEAWHVVGHDAGATVAAHYAAGHPDRVERLVLMAPPLFGDFRPPVCLRMLRMPVLGELLAPFLLRLLWSICLPLALASPDAASRALLGAFETPFRGLAGRRRFLRLARWGDPAVVLGRVEALLPRILAPTLVLHGAGDIAIPADYARRAAEAIPGARLQLEDAGHFLPLEQPELLVGALRAFLTPALAPVAAHAAATSQPAEWAPPRSMARPMGQVAQTAG